MFGIDWNQLPQAALAAGATLIIIAPFAAALTEIVKRGFLAFNSYLPPEAAAYVAAIISTGLTVGAMIGQGIMWPVAVAASVIAVFGAKTAYDAATISGDRKNELRGGQ